jgi:hypothetical protein
MFIFSFLVLLLHAVFRFDRNVLLKVKVWTDLSSSRGGLAVWALFHRKGMLVGCSALHRVTKGLRVGSGSRFRREANSISFTSFSSRLTTGPKRLSKRAFHIVISRASSFRCEYPLLSLRSSSSFLRVLPRLSVTSIPHFIFPSITCCRKQFLRKMWPIQLAFRLLIWCRIFLCPLTVSNTFSFLTWSAQLISSTAFHNSPDVTDLLPEASKFQHHVKLYSKCSI